MSLQDYLTKYFPNGSIGEYEGQSVNIVEHFIDKFGVDVKIENNLFMFKYDLLLAKFSQKITYSCRGHILKNENGIWKFVSRPWDKFFNTNESYCSLFDNETFKSELHGLSIVEKVDGSAIQCFYDDEKFRATTLGMINSGCVQHTTQTFGELFWNTSGKTSNDFLEIADKEYTYLFEVATIFNQVVTSYNDNQIVLLSIRHTEKGFYKSVSEVEEFKNKMVEKGFKVRLPYRMYISEIDGVKDYETFKIWVETVGIKIIELFSNCKNGEGFVIYSESYPRAKFKSLKYVMLHQLNSDEKHTINVVIDSYFNGIIDDIFGDLKDNMKIFVESLNVKVSSIVKEVDKCFEHICGIQFETQKDYALTVQKYVPKQFHSFFFSHKEKLKTGNGNELFRKWLYANYQKFESIWKS